MKVLVLGCGNIGSVAAQDFAESMSSVEVFVADKNVTRAKEVADAIGTSNVAGIQLDASNYNKLVHTLEAFDLAIGFLPGALGYRSVKACVDAGKDLVDVSFMAENPLVLNDEAVRANATIIPSAGLAPGISNILVGHASGVLDETRKVHIMVGGLPATPVPPLDYIITFAVQSVIDEYTRKARIIEGSEMIDVEALSGLEEVEFPGVGRLEAFYTDGLGTLLHTVKDVESMWEKTLRYPGHAKKIELLKTLGFFDEEPIDVEGVSISPRELSARLLGQKLFAPGARDIVAMKVETSGVKGGKHVSYTYHLFDRYDERKGTTAMARTTAYTASIIAQLVLGKVIREKGVVPPERIGRSEEFFSTFLKELGKRGIEVTEKEVYS
ncbi:MAG: saccharopine dehydrogenase family protein [Candidatus Bathyarchaeota archaeon]|nr:MAG: saccharopine dehydrogenase family protein [Candidatus Bathyarchaeota archaeon]